MTTRRTSEKSKELARCPKLQQQPPFLEHGKSTTKMCLLPVRELTLQAEVVVTHNRLGLKVGHHLLSLAVLALTVHSITHHRAGNHQQTANKIVHRTKTEWASIYRTIQATKDSSLVKN
jgi:hypothetical protein